MLLDIFELQEKRSIQDDVGVHETTSSCCKYSTVIIIHNPISYEMIRINQDKILSCQFDYICMFLHSLRYFILCVAWPGFIWILGMICRAKSHLASTYDTVSVNSAIYWRRQMRL